VNGSSHIKRVLSYTYIIDRIVISVIESVCGVDVMSCTSLFVVVFAKLLCSLGIYMYV